MTWVVGIPTIIGAAVGVADIRVTYNDPVTGNEVYRDCLRKMYEVGSDVAMGFAGSVAIGFQMIQQLQIQLARGAAGSAVYPLSVADGWPAVAQQIFAAAPDDEKFGGCELMMFSADPDEEVGMSLPKTYVHIFRAPDFKPESVAAQVAKSIGSGSGEAGCIAALEELTGRDAAKASLIQIGFLGRGALAAMVNLSLRDHIADKSPAYISPFLTTCSVTRGDAGVGYSDWTTHTSEGTVTRPMPEIANSYGELLEMLGMDAGQARGLLC